MNGASSHEPVPGRPLLWAALPALPALFVAITACVITVAYADCYFTLLDAQKIAAGMGFSSRPPLEALLLSPVAWVEAKAAAYGLLFRTSCLLAAIFYAASLYAFYRVLRLERLTKNLCLSAAFVLGINPLLLQSAPVLREESCALAFLLASLFFYRKTLSKGRLRDYIRLSAASTLLMSSSYRLAAVLALSIPLVETLRNLPRAWREKDMTLAFESAERHRLMTATLAVPLAFSFALALVTRGPAGLSEYFGGLGNLAHTFTRAAESPFAAYRFLLTACTAPVLALAAAGLFRSFRVGAGNAARTLAWFGVPFLLQAHAMAHTEARFLTVFLPGVYFFAAHGIDFLLRGFPRWSLRPPRMLSLAVAALALLPSAHESLRAVRRYADPVYSADFAARVSKRADRLAGKGAVFWVGEAQYALAPRDHAFHEQDRAALVYYFNGRVVHVHAGRRIESAESLQIHVPAEMAGFLLEKVVPNHGDAFIFNPEPSFAGSGLPDPGARKPLMVGRFRWMEFVRDGVDASGRHVLRSENASLHLGISPDKWVLSAEGMNSGMYEFYAESGGRKRLSAGKIMAQNGGWNDLDFKPLDAGVPERVFLLTHDSVEAFYPPGTKTRK